ncbi:radical SAM protein [Candidatus Falkowbacteria bacterium]|nr:radical SAM protein [Candidatus Falkowbacteria bacterium]MBT7007492.1 radical SAM protein [Candidatus Falkowbacteria bacterium]
MNKKIGIDTNTKKKEQLKNKKVLLNFNHQKWSEPTYGPYFKTILLFITNRCNLNCSFCFDNANVHGLEEMSFDYIKKIVDNNPQVNKYDIMGGEPLLHNDLDKILRYLAKKGKKIGLYTNGFLLHKLKDDYDNLKVNIAFHSINSKNKSLKPIACLNESIKKIQQIYPLKVVFLITNKNKKLLLKFAKYIENNFKLINKLTIGLVRNEEDYYNDNYEGIVSFDEYVKIVKDYVNNYGGTLDLDIFAEGMLYTNKLPFSQKNQINRFKCVFVDNKYTSCLYDIGPDKKNNFDPEKRITYSNCELCPKTGKNRCLTDKIKLKREKNT